MELDFKAIGKRIKIARINKNMTQETVADRIGVTPQHVSNIETGNSSVSLTTLVAIANLLKVSADELLCDTILIAKDGRKKWDYYRNGETLRTLRRQIKNSCRNSGQTISLWKKAYMRNCSQIRMK